MRPDLRRYVGVCMSCQNGKPATGTLAMEPLPRWWVAK